MWAKLPGWRKGMPGKSSRGLRGDPTPVPQLHGYSCQPARLQCTNHDRSQEQFRKRGLGNGHIVSPTVGYAADTPEPVRTITEVVTVSDDEDGNQPELKSDTETTEEARLVHQVDKRRKIGEEEVKKHGTPSPEPRKGFEDTVRRQPSAVQ